MQSYVSIVSGFIIALGISLYVVPVVVRIVLTLRFLDHPNERSAAKKPVPTLGGIAIFLSFIFGATIALYQHEFPELIYIFTAILLTFFVGLKDDILQLPPWKKILAELIASGLIIFMAKIRISNLHGFLGIGEIGLIPSAILTAFVIIVFINSFNLMDGIDGLAAAMSMFFSTVFGVWFLISGHIDYAILSFTLLGSITGFFYFNVFGKKNKIFMGDTGSLMLGTMLSVIVIQFNEFNIDQSQPFAIAASPVISFAILFYPLADMVRVFMIRVILKKSPFYPDKNHLHHRFLTLGFSHKNATYTILFTNILFIIPIFALQHIGIFRLLLLTLFFGGLLFIIPAMIIQEKNLIKDTDPQQHIILFNFRSAKFGFIKSNYVNSPALHQNQISKFQKILQKLNLW